MLLKSLKLKNIRSYTEQAIDFPEGSILLNGDIGSGKSTLLLAIEFALFGISKNELSGEALLKKGAFSGGVELELILEDKKITIQRSLKKNKEAIVQSSGHLIINNTKKELAPVELKSEIIRLFNYPEELVTRNKNYIFRYTVYCPQEEMKLILEETSETRQDILRKIFNLDKYKRIRENLEYYLKEMRLRSIILRERLTPFDQKKKELEDLRKEKESLTQKICLLLPEIKKISEEIQLQEKKISEAEKTCQEHFLIKNRLSYVSQSKESKKKELEKQQEKKKQIETQLKEITVQEKPEDLEQELSKLQEQLLIFSSRQSELKTKLKTGQEQTISTEKEIRQLISQLSIQKERERQSQELEKELAEKEAVKKKKEEISRELDLAKQGIHQNQSASEQATEIKDKINRFCQCPTCLQKISKEYKEKIIQEQQQKGLAAESQLQKLREKRKELEQSQSEISQKLEIISQKENQLTKIKTELQHWKEKEELLKAKKEELAKLQKKEEETTKELKLLNPEDYFLLKQQISQKQERLRQAFQKREWEKNYWETEVYIKENELKIKEWAEEEAELKTKLNFYPDLTLKIIEQKQQLKIIQEKEKALNTEKTRLETNQEHLAKLIKPLLNEINQLTKYQSDLLKLMETSYWLEEHFLKLTFTIEKQVMRKIHYLFNCLFQEWFSILIENEDFSARLDEEFTPVIEQKGYEINFSNLSGGERTAAALAYRLALNKVINDIIPEIKTKGLLILDEPTDGFSSEQLDKIRDVLDKLNLRQVIIVSHENKIENLVEKVIKVRKEEGTSQINGF